jgi:hypothetical protein
MWTTTAGYCKTREWETENPKWKDIKMIPIMDIEMFNTFHSRIAETG